MEAPAGGEPDEVLSKEELNRLGEVLAKGLTSNFQPLEIVYSLWGLGLVGAALVALGFSGAARDRSWWEALWLSASVTLTLFGLFHLLLKRRRHSIPLIWCAGLAVIGGFCLVVSPHIARWWSSLLLEAGVGLLFLAAIELGIGPVLADADRLRDERRLPGVDESES